MELIINDTVIDLGNTTVTTSKKLIDLDNPTDRFIQITNQFTIPDTNETRKLFSSAQLLNTDSEAFDVYYSAIIRDAGIQLFRGKGILSDYKPGSGFKFQIVDSSKDFYNALKIKLNEIAWDDCDVFLTMNSYTDIGIDTQRAVSQCWTWPVYCCHEQMIGQRTQLDQNQSGLRWSRPSFYLMSLLNREVNLVDTGQVSGYSWAFDMTTTEGYLAMTANHKDFFFTSYQKTLTGTISGYITNLNASYDTAVNVTLASTTINVGSMKTKFRLRGDVALSSDVTLTVYVTYDGGEQQSKQYTISHEDTYIDISTDEFSNDVSSTVSFYFSGSITLSGVLLYTLVSEKSVDDYVSNPFLNMRIKAHDNLPDLTYYDILKTFCLITNSVPVVDQFTNVLSLKRLDFLEKGNTIDWSDKFVRKSETISPDYGKLGKLNYLKYDNDKFAPTWLGEGIFEGLAEYLPEKADYFKLGFGASQDKKFYFSGVYYDMACIPIYRDAVYIDGELQSPTHMSNDINIRLLNLVPGTIYTANFLPIRFETIKEAYYKNLTDSLYKSRVIEVEFNLKRLDFINIDLTEQLIYIEQFASLFMILELNNFRAGYLCTAKLLKFR